MQSLSKGANAALPGDTVTVQVACSSPVDVSALLLTAAGKVRSDADMVFYNQPAGPGVQHRAAASGSPDSVVVTTTALPAEVETVAVTASLDGSGPTSFGAVGSLVVTVLDGSGAPAVGYDVQGLGPETAVLCVEVYRRSGAWKVRAVGQGWASGLAGIATDFGITVDDAPPAPTAPAPTTPAPTTPAAASSPPPSYARPVAETPPAPAGPPPSYSRPPVQPPPPTGRPVNLAPPPRAATPMVNLDKGRVSLTKRQSVSLVKTGAPALRTVRMGLGWDPAKRGADVDLDASVIAFDAKGKDVELVWYGNLSGLGGAVVHSGDNLTGEGDGDDEVITLHLDRVPASVVALVFTVNSFRGQVFTELKTAYCRLLDDRGSELVRYDLGETEARTGVLLCRLVREPAGTWSMTALGEFHDGRNVKKMVDPARAGLPR